MRNTYLFFLEAEVVSFILTNLLIYDVSATYDDFISFFLAWEADQPRSRVRFVIENMEWEKMYDYHYYACETQINRFYTFVEQSAHINVLQASFLNSSRKLLKQQNVQHHLSVLHASSNRHFPSYFAYLVFKAIYMPFELQESLNQMFQILKHTDFKYKVREVIMLLASFKEKDEGELLMPVFKFCPHARHPLPFNIDQRPISKEDVWNSLCNKVVQEDFMEGDYWSKDVCICMILNSECEYCAMQVIVYKVLLNDIM